MVRFLLITSLSLRLAANNFISNNNFYDLPCDNLLQKYEFKHSKNFNYDNAVMILLSAYMIEKYSDDDLHEKLNNWGFNQVKIVENKKSATKFFIASNDQFVIVIFRGTVKIKSWFSNSDFFLKSAKNLGFPGSIHTGFLNSFTSIVPDLTKSIDELKIHKKPIYFGGHSLGGVQSVLAALYLQKHNDINIQAVYSSAQPKIGNTLFVDFMRKILKNKYFRFNLLKDITPNVPPSKYAATEFSNIIHDNFLDARKALKQTVIDIDYECHAGVSYILGDRNVITNIDKSDEINYEKAFWNDIRNKLSRSSTKDMIDQILSHFRTHNPTSYVCEFATQSLH